MSCRTATTSTTQTADAPRNEISPINRLPPETLTQIADFSCRNYDAGLSLLEIGLYVVPLGLDGRNGQNSNTSLSRYNRLEEQQ